METPNPIPAFIGPYRLFKLLGEGGMGVVYLAGHREGASRVALKTLTGVTPERVRSIRREVRALKKLRHPHIVQIVDEGIEGGVPWYAMEFLVGMPLDLVFRGGDPSGVPPLTDVDWVGTRVSAPPQVLAGKTMSWTASLCTLAQGLAFGDPVAAALVETRASATEVRLPALLAHDSEVIVDRHCFGERERRNLALLSQIADALVYLHGEGLVHCDLKPQNIIVTRDGRAVLVDFGLVASRGGGTPIADIEEAGLAAGTALYLAPERIRGEDFDDRLDLYALGCMMYEAIVGRPAFLRPTVAQTLLAHISESAPWVDDHIEGVPLGLQQLVRTLMETRPDRRPAHAQFVVWTLGEAGIERPEARGDVKPNLYSSTIVGRTGLIEDVLTSVAAVIDGKPDFVVLSGETGIGKSRIALEVARQARNLSMQILVGKCEVGQPLEKGVRQAAPLNAFARVLETIAQRVRSREEAEIWFGIHGKVLAPYLPCLRELPGHDEYPDLVPLEYGASVQRIFRAIHHVLTAYLGDRSSLLVIEDLQWADELSLGALSYLRDHLSRQPWLILGGFRSDERSDEVQGLIGGQGIRVIEVGRLTDGETRSMLRSILGGEAVPESLEGFVLRHSAGNPFFVVSCLRTAAESGHLRVDDRGDWQFDEADGLWDAPMPTTLASLIDRRLSFVESSAWPVVVAASVLGAETATELLQAVAQIPDFDEALAHLISRKILEVDSIGDHVEVRFAHQIMQESVYQTLLEVPDELASIHSRAATAYSSLAGELSAMELAILARHLECGRRPEEARSRFFDAAKLAAQVYAHSQAEALLEDGLRLTQVDDDESLSATLLVIDNVLKACGRVDEAEGRLIALLEKTQEAGFQSLYCQALGSLGDLLLRTGRANEARPIFCRAIDGFDELGNVDAVAETRRRMGLVHHVQGRYQAALSDYEDALGLARQVGALAVARRSLGSIANLHSETGEYKLALAFFSEAIASSNEDDDRRMVNSFIANTGLVHYRLGQYPAALAHYQRSLALARELGDWPGVGHDLGSIGLVHLERGLPERALAFFVEALKIAREVEDRRLEAAWLGNLAWVRWKQRSVELALDLSAEALEIAREVGDSEQEAMWLHSLGLIQERLAQKISARDYQTKALEIAHATENRNQEVRVLVALSRLDRLDGRRPEALAWLERASAMPQKTVFRLVSGAYHCERSWLALASNEPARPSFDQAREIADALELTPGADLRVALEELSQALDGQNGQTDGLG